MADFELTESQKAAIQTTGTSILVSAGAGSGKTAVLAERCAHLAADQRPACPVDRLLVVTFTEAAAAEMRQRIAAALRERLQAAPTNRWLQQQLALLDTASISTIHSFCRQTLNRYFAQADLEPRAPIMDARDASLLRQETARQVFDSFAERSGPAGEAFLDLLAAYGGSGELGLIQRVLAVDGFLNSIPDPQRWLTEAAARFAVPPDGGLADSWATLLADTLRSELAEQLQTLTGTITGLRESPPIVSASLTCLENYHGVLQEWSDQLEQGSGPEVLDRVCRDGIGAYRFPAAPRRSKKTLDLPESEQQAFTAAADLVRSIRNESFKKRLQDVFGRFTTADWAEGIARTRRPAETFLSLVNKTRQAYQREKRELGAVDFADLERMTLDLLTDEDNGVAARLRDQYEHVLVDEFQDVNPIQAKILRLVSREGQTGRAGNLFAVGDVKQSIYRFRLAEPRMFLNRQESFAAAGAKETGQTPGLVIDLVDNFRSHRRVIDAVNAVFERLMAPDLGGIEYDQHARLKAGRRDDHDLTAPPLELHLLDDLAGPQEEDSPDSAEAFDWERIEREAYLIAERIKTMVRRGSPYRDMVILLRSMRPRAGLLMRTLWRLGVPVFADSTGGFFESLEVLDLLSLLTLLDNQQQDIPLAAVLRSPLFGQTLTDDELVEIRTAVRQRRPDTPFHAAVQDYAHRGANQELRLHLASIFDRLQHWRRRVHRRPLADVLWEIFDQSGYLAYVSGLHGGQQRRANLMRLHEYARQFDTFRRQGLHRFLQFITGLQEAGEDLDAGSVVSPSEDVVRVMTVHRSKGLEFPVVILAELGKRFNLADARGAILFDRRLGVALEAVDTKRRITYPTLPHRLVSQAAVYESLAEELRVLYVALTRGQEKLILVGTGSLSTLQRDRRRFAGHVGVLPALDRRTAKSMLHWVTASACCRPPDDISFVEGATTEQQADSSGAPGAPGTTAASTTKPPLFEVHTYDRRQMAEWVIDPPQPAGASERLKRCSRMESSGQTPGANVDQAAVEIVTRRLTTAYPALSLTRVPAVVAASVLKRRWEAGQDLEEPAASWSGGTGGSPPPTSGQHAFRQPAFGKPDRLPAQASRGTWTHEFLQRLDLGRPCDAQDLRAQLEDLVDADIMLADEAAGIDLDGVAWFFETPLGTRLRSENGRPLREWPFVMGVDPSRYDPVAEARDDEDLLLVRGIIDCLFDVGDGWEIIDYKTDRVSGDPLTARAAEYKGQLNIYADAVEAVWHRQVTHRWLAFLSARQIVEV